MTDHELLPEYQEPGFLGLSYTMWLRILAPSLIGVLTLGAWEWAVRYYEVPRYILPGPILVAETLVRNWGSLSVSLGITLQITFMALAVAASLGLALSVLFAQSRIIELSLFPYAVILQVTPIVAIAPLLLVYLDANTAVLVCAFLVAFFPILSNMALGLASADHNLIDLFELYKASRWKQLILLRLPAALPYFLGGLRIAGGLALIGAIVAEIAAGSAGQGAGLAYRIVEAGYRLNIPRMFAALVLISASGILIYLVFTLLSYLLLSRWHDSARERGL
jgi:NitT/TauT family transport system permease protein